ncbi:hypothetical protein AGLY_016859 [Aphis glycines]|uniref:HAT C-terminal dimerisation domain-containing protein n=1 Tax=Aphis glycines TaxID=307491 RepID=A0A6G0SWI0_APHGL|nr:hypothetical protein AGLY_016859 [Aphis glycines]
MLKCRIVRPYDLLEENDLRIQLDEWTNINNDGIINFVIPKPRPLFVKFLNTIDNRDNAANVKKSFELVKNVYTGIQSLGCAAHGLHLLFLESNHNLIHTVRSLLNDVEKKVEACFSSSITNSLFSISKELKIINDVAKIKIFILGKIHLTAELLNPKSQGQELNADERVDQGYFAKKFIWENSLITELVKWWKFLDHISPLSKVAVRILTIPCTFAATKRTFSTFS